MESPLPSLPSVERAEAPPSLYDVTGRTPTSNGLIHAVPDEIAARHERAIVGVTSVGHFLCHLAEVMFPCLLLAVCAEFSLARDEGTFVALLGYVLFGAGALPVGLWADRWGTRNLFCGYFFLVAGSAVAVALAPNMLGLFLALTALGLSASIYHPAGLSMISLGVARRSRAMGINGVAGNLGIASAPLVAWIALSGLGDWRWAYAILAVLAVAGGMVMLWAVHRGLLETISQPARAAEPVASGFVSPPVRSGTRYAPLVLLMSAMMLAGINYRCMITALPSYLAFDTHVWLAALPLVVGGIGQILGGLLGDRIGARPIYLVMVGLLIPLAVLLSLLEGSGFAVAVASLLAVTMFAQQPVENTLLAESTSAARRSVSYGWKFVLTFGVGAFGTQVVGEIWEYTGSLAPVFALMACLASLMLALLIVQRRQAARLAATGATAAPAC